MRQEDTKTANLSVPKKLKILFVGNSFAVDATWHLADIALAMGVEHVKVGTLHANGCSINMHIDHIENNTPAYVYYTNDGNGWNSKEPATFADAAADDAWDWILLIGGTKDGSRNTDPASYSNLPLLMKHLQNFGNSQARFAFLMPWMGEVYCQHPEIASYGGDHAKMYAALANVMQNTIQKLDGIECIIPAGTAVQNARSAQHEQFTRDGYHLSWATGRYIAALSIFQTLTGVPIDSIAWMPEGMDPYSQKIAIEAVNHAAQKPFSVTPSSVTEVPFPCFRLFREVDALYEPFLTIWSDLCRIESPTDCKEGVDAVGNYFEEYAKKRDWKIERFPQEKYGDVVCITMNPNAEKSPIALSGHMDTVHPIGFFGESPVRLDEENIYGPGVADCKGGLAAALMAMEALHRMGYKERPVRLLLQSNEEIGSVIEDRSTTEYLCKMGKDCAAFLNLENAFTEGEVCIERKGIITFTFTVTGIEAHASLCATAGANAILAAAHKIIEIEKWKDDNGITCCCSTIKGGNASNTVPGLCTFRVNTRFATAAQMEEICQFMENLSHTVTVPGCTCSLEHTKGRVAGELSVTNAALVTEINRILAANELSQVTAVKKHIGSDASDISAYGIPCVDVLGVVGGNIHTREEYAVKASLKNAAKRLAAIIYGM